MFNILIFMKSSPSIQPILKRANDLEKKANDYGEETKKAEEHNTRSMNLIKKK